MTYNQSFAGLCHCIDNNYTTIRRHIPDFNNSVSYDDDRDFILSCTVSCNYCPYYATSPRWCNITINNLQTYINDLKPIYPELFI